MTSSHPSRGSKARLRTKILAAMVVIAVVILAVIALRASKPQAPKPTLIEKLPLVNTDRLQITSSRPAFKTIGQITASSASMIVSQVTGTVTEVFVEDGEKVVKGQQLLSIDPKEQARQQLQASTAFTQANTALEQAQIQHKTHIVLLEKEQRLVALAEKSLKRYQDLQRQNLATQAQIDQADEVVQRQSASALSLQTTVNNWPSQLVLLQSQLKLAKAQLDQANEDLAQTQIQAPFTGTISQVTVAPAAQITPNQSLFGIYDEKQLVMKASLSQEVMATLRTLNKKPYQITAKGTIWGETFEFTLKALSQRQGSGGGSVAVFSPVNPERLPVNRALEAFIELPYFDNAFDIPVVALHNHQFIYTLDSEGILQRVSVTVIGETYVQNERRYLITGDDLKANATYVTSQMTRDVNGMKVQPTNAPDSELDSKNTSASEARAERESL